MKYLLAYLLFGSIYLSLIVFGFCGTELLMEGKVYQGLLLLALGSLNMLSVQEAWEGVVRAHKS